MSTVRVNLGHGVVEVDDDGDIDLDAADVGLPDVRD